MKRIVLSWVLAAVSAFWARPGSAQVVPQSPNLRGVVTDQAGAAIPEADVVIFHEGTTVAHVTTDAQGQFAFRARPMEYQVLVRGSSPGFLELRSGPVPFRNGSLSHFTLQIDNRKFDPVVEPSTVPPTATTLITSLLQESPVRQAASGSGWEYGVLAQGGVGVEDRSNYKFLLLGGHLGKVLTPQVGSGLLQGNFEYAVEVFPFWQSYTPRFQKVSCQTVAGAAAYQCSQPYTVGGTYTGVSVTPIMLRWNFTHGQRWMPWLQGAGGVVWTDHKYPAIGNTNTTDIASNGPSGDTSVWNFTPQFGIGTHIFLKSRRSLDLSANAVHISSASLGDKNPGVNASVQFSIGYTWWK